MYVINDKVEGEIYTFFSVLDESQHSLELEEILLFLSSSVYDELRDGTYLDHYDVNELKAEIKNSIYIIMGREVDYIEDIYNTCIDNIEQSAMNHLHPIVF
ncbi:hypothetical protein F3157_21325 [Virgibacillus dakarensis]|uniref:Uncharacterized protein n=1 Tax=Lentibacillus populi TaxID=1827502 RepID=A0A9W5U0A9_9BACI|nr:hypothetical protein [Virgibacillus dakarensis]GGB50353.1 hypothetical protein GCM10011409_29940 [Lentibacillus populi]